MGVFAEQKNEPAVRIGGRKRHMGLEYLRVLAAYMVVINHAWFMERSATLPDIFMTALVYSVVLVAVPLFVLLSGAFLITNEKNISALSFWKHSFIKLFPLSFCFFVLAFFWETSMWEHFLAGKMDLPQLGWAIISWYGGGAAAPLWYLCMLPGLYFMLPFLARLWQKTSKQRFFILGLSAYCVYAVAEVYEINLPHPFSAVFWLGLFMLGASILKSGILTNKYVRIALCFVYVACLVVCICHLNVKISENTAIYDEIGQNYLPFNLILAPCLFAFFAAWKPARRAWVLWLSRLSFLVYLTHVPCQRVIRAILYHSGYIEQLHEGWVNNLLFALASCIFATVAAWVIDKVYGSLVAKRWFSRKSATEAGK